MRAAWLVVACSMAAVTARAGTIDPSAVGVTERLGERVALDLPFTDERGRPVLLGDYFGDGKPVLLVLAYFDCPMLCGLVLSGAARALGDIGWTPGEDYRVLTVSFDPEDDPYDARQKQAAILGALAPGIEPARWPFLTGGPDAIRALARALGFTAIRDEATGQFAHPAVVFALGADGLVSRYLYGIAYEPHEVKLALFEAARGRVGSTVERAIMRCYAYDPATRRYGVYVTGVMRAGGAVILGAVGALVGVLWRRDRRRRAPR